MSGFPGISSGVVTRSGWTVAMQTRSVKAPGDPASNAGRPGWMYGVRQYGLHSLLLYLTTVEGVDRSILTAGFYSGTSMSPQEYIYTNVGT